MRELFTPVSPSDIQIAMRWLEFVQIRCLKVPLRDELYPHSPSASHLSLLSSHHPLPLKMDATQIDSQLNILAMTPVDEDSSGPTFSGSYYCVIA
ncbi:hypothetical protein FS749_005596 [Ceratobasidium sp. UAMH 11750]|nr:hypothetical protein FS749_005596 [Ceratobasidium sp. UAMH 11750]